MSGFRTSIGGVAVVCCVHDKPKREVVELAFDPTRTKLHLCACCENLFTERTDTPMFCPTCRGGLKHPLGGPLPEPTGVI
jgi:hypothetical protein